MILCHTRSIQLAVGQGAKGRLSERVSAAALMHGLSQTAGLAGGENREQLAHPVKKPAASIRGKKRQRTVCRRRPETLKP